MRKNLQFNEKEFILGPENAYLPQSKGLQGMHIESNLILNVFIILLPIMFYRFVCRSNKTVLYFLLFLVPLIITMSFPVKVFNTFLDLRGIPLVVGSLYGGVYSALLLFASAIFIDKYWVTFILFIIRCPYCLHWCSYAWRFQYLTVGAS